MPDVARESPRLACGARYVLERRADTRRAQLEEIELEVLERETRAFHLVEQRATPLEQIVQGRPLASEQGEPTVIVGVARVPLGECDALVQRTERGAADIGVEAMERDRQCCNALHESVDRRRDVGQHLTLDL